PERERGEGQAVEPAGRILETRPSFAWTPVPGADEYRVAVSSSDGAVLWNRTSAIARLDYPPDVAALEEGRAYVWEVSAKGPLGRVEVRRAFAIASASARDAFRAARAAIEAEVEEPLRATLEANVALRGGLLVEARRILEARVRAAPDD